MTADRPVVIFHAGCPDGFCAAWVAQTALGAIEAVPAHYGSAPPDVRGRIVYLLDFSYPRRVMRTLLGQARRVVVLDHHTTAQAALEGLVDEFVQRPDLIATDLQANPQGQELPLIWFDTTKSAARLVWEHFHPRATGSPWLVDYTEDRDLWRHALPDSDAINAALRSYPRDFALWTEFAQAVDTVPRFILEGRAIRRREVQIVAEHVRRARLLAFDDEHVVPVVNATVLCSEIAGELAKGQPFAACYFDRQDGQRQWSLRSDAAGLDVSAIASARGGGGHTHAAGFEEVI